MSELSAEEHPQKSAELVQLGIDVFCGHRWEAFANGVKIPHNPDAPGEGA